MNLQENQQPIYQTNYLGFWIKVFRNRVEFKAGAGTQNIPISQIASIQLGMLGYMQIIMETAGGKKYPIPCMKKKEVKEAIYKAQEFAFNPGSVTISSLADELSKLSQLNKDGIISDQEFEQQKKKLLS